MQLELPELGTERLRLARFTSADVTSSYLETLNDSWYMRFSNQRYTQHNKLTCENYRTNLAESGGGLLACVETEHGDLACTISLSYSQQHRWVDIGLLVVKGYEGLGVGSEAWGAVVEWLSVQPNVRKITAGTSAGNLPMISIIQGSGLQVEGRRNAQEIVEGTPTDVLLFGKLLKGF